MTSAGAPSEYEDQAHAPTLPPGRPGVNDGAQRLTIRDADPGIRPSGGRQARVRACPPGDGTARRGRTGGSAGTGPGERVTSRSGTGRP